MRFCRDGLAVEWTVCGELGGWLRRVTHDVAVDASLTAPDLAERIATAWRRVVSDCGCGDLYCCPASDEIECQRHGGFDVCCNKIALHVPVR
jgi:hypothetical protein